MPSVDDEDRQEQIVIRQRRYEREIEHVPRHRRPAQPDGSAEIVGVGDDQPDEFGNRDRGHAEIMARQPQRRHADDGRYRDAHDDTDGNAHQRRQAEMRVSAHRGVGAATEEHDMPDRHLAGIAADDVPGRCSDRIKQHQRAEPLLERRREHQRIGDDQRQHDGKPRVRRRITSCPSGPAAGTRGSRGTGRRRPCPCRRRRSDRPTGIR